MRHLAFISILILLVSGCVEPYPGWSVADVPVSDLPRAVTKAFRKDFPDARITKAERSTFESRMSGYPRAYRIFFERSGGGSERAIYDTSGKRADGIEFWFDRPPPNKGAAAPMRVVNGVVDFPPGIFQ